jgi:sec-independent protein translocase protein TatC
MVPCQQLRLRAQRRRSLLFLSQHLKATASVEERDRSRRNRRSRGRGRGLHLSVRAEPPEVERSGEESTSSTTQEEGGGAEDQVSLVPQASAKGPKSIEAYEREFAQADLAEMANGAESKEDKTAVQQFLFPDKEELPDDVEMSIWEHLEELRERVLVSVIGVGVMITGCFCYSKQLVEVLESPVADKGVKFLQLSPGEFFFTSFKVCSVSFFGSRALAQKSHRKILIALPYV